jgi:DNA polymerase elongation subunit (family B)
MNNSNIYLDIETGRDDILTDAWIASRDYRAPKNYVDPLKIATAIEGQKLKDRENAARELQTLRIGVISWALDDDPVQSLANHGIDEQGMLKTFTEILKECITIITFNGSSFDLPALRMRMFHWGLSIPHILQPGQKPWDTSLQFDLRQSLTNNDRSMKGRLEDWCRYAGVVGPVSHDGAEIARLINKGEFKIPTETCQSDVIATRNLHHHMIQTNWI